MYKPVAQMLGVVVLLFMAGDALSAEKGEVKVAVASAGTDRTSKISMIAAHAPYLLMFDKKGDMTEAANNPAAGAVRRAGFIAADFLAQNKVTIFIAGDIGQRMADALKDKRIRFIKEKGLVCDAVNAALNLSIICQKR